MNKAVVGIVNSRDRAESVLANLQRAGIATSNVSVLLPDKSGTKDFAHEHNTKAPEGAIAGVGAGAVVGGTIGLLAGIGALAIPGVGPLIAAGPLMAALSGSAAGAALGGVTGALVGMGIPELEAKRYEGKVIGGNILVAVHTENGDQQKVAKQAMEQAGAEDVSVASESAVPKAKAEGRRELT